MRFENKVCLVLGGGGSIGSATARIYAKEGGIVVLSDLYPERAQAVAEEINSTGGKAEYMPCNCNKECEVQALVKAVAEKYGRIDVAFNAFSGKAMTPDICNTTEEQFRAVIDGYLTNFFFAIKHEGAQMVKQRSGSIVSLTSVNAFSAVKGQPVYNAAKAGFDLLSKTLAMEIGPKNVRVNTVAPGGTKTNLVGETFKNQEIVEEVLYMTPLRRINEPEDIAMAAAFLSSDDARQITGVQLVVDGGCFLKGFPESYEILNGLPRHYVPGE